MEMRVGNVSLIPSLAAYLGPDLPEDPDRLAETIHDFHDRHSFVPSYFIIPQILALVLQHPNLTRYGEVVSVECGGRTAWSGRKRASFRLESERCGECPPPVCLVCLPTRRLQYREHPAPRHQYDCVATSDYLHWLTGPPPRGVSSSLGGRDSRWILYIMGGSISLGLVLLVLMVKKVELGLWLSALRHSLKRRSQYSPTPVHEAHPPSPPPLPLHEFPPPRYDLALDMTKPQDRHPQA